MLGHFQDRVHRFLLSALDERTGVHDDNVGVLGLGSEFRAGTRQQSHHDLAVDEVLGTAQADESDLRRRRLSFGLGCLSELQIRHAIFLL